MFGSWANRKAGSAKRSSFWSEQSIFRQTQRYNNTEHNIYNEKLRAQQKLAIQPTTEFFSSSSSERIFSVFHELVKAII